MRSELLRKILMGFAVASLAICGISAPSASAVSSSPTPNCAAITTCTVTFSYTGDYYSWTVPNGITSLTVDAQGASGGAGWTGYLPGKGGRVQATLSVTAGATLYFYVGGTGSLATTSVNAGTGGWNGGGLGGTGNGTPPNCWCGTGGGGASDIRTTAGTLSSRILVAGGGGGLTANLRTTADAGGDGGGTTGASSVGAASGSTQATGGTQSSGGVGNKWSSTWAASSNGSLGIGSDAGLGTGGGGGGGGYYGGAGGSWTGGGGGSSYTDPVLATGVTHTQGYRTGSGQIIVTYLRIIPQSNTSLAMLNGGNPVAYRSSIPVIATVDQPGRVTFFARGKKIPGCVAISVLPGNVTCNWKPSVRSSLYITATLTPNNGYNPSSSQIFVGIAPRSGNR